MKEEGLLFYESVLKQFDETADFLNLPQNLRIRLKYPKAEHHFNLFAKMDNNEVKRFPAYRVIHNTARGPAKGGIRYSENADINEVKALATIMTWKCAFWDIDYGGAKGAVVVNPKNHSLQELRRLTRRYAYELRDIIGPDKDIPAPDSGTDEKIMNWIMDGITMLRGETCLAVVTGKSISCGGIPGRREATGRGVSIITLEALQKIGISPRETTFIIEGFGNVGSVAAKILSEKGKIIGLSDSSGGIFNPRGINVNEAEKYKEATKKLNGLPACQILSSKELLTKQCDALILAAKENSLTLENADDVKAKVIIEGANGPITFEADKILRDKNIFIVPDILASGAGVYVSYLEWQQNKGGTKLKKVEVNKNLERKMKETFNELLKYAEDNRIDLRKAALSLGISRVAEAAKDRDLWP